MKIEKLPIEKFSSLLDEVCKNRFFEDILRKFYVFKYIISKYRDLGRGAPKVWTGEGGRTWP